jgi:ligand-binding sensor protein
MQMTDLQPVEAWAGLEREIFDRFGLNGRVYDARGFTFTSRSLWGNELCPAIRATPQGVQSICSVAHQAMAAQLTPDGGVLTGECDAGLLKICCPVMVRGELVGVVGGCGRVAAGSEVDGYLVEMMAGVGETEVERLAAMIEPMGPEEVDEVCAFLAQRRDSMLSRAGIG